MNRRLRPTAGGSGSVARLGAASWRSAIAVVKSPQMLAVWGGVALLVVAVAGCGARVSGDEGGGSGSGSSGSDTTESSSGQEPVVGWFELGFGDTAFTPLHDGDALPVVWGGQGAAMFPLPVRGAEFVLPDPPSDYTSELAPLFDFELDIEGYNDGPGGHFKRAANYPITFEVLPDGSYEFLYVAVLLPDELDPGVLEGLPAHLWARLRPHGSAPFEVEYDLVVAAPR